MTTKRTMIECDICGATSDVRPMTNGRSTHEFCATCRRMAESVDAGTWESYTQGDY